MTNYAFCRCNERPSIWERVHSSIIIIFFLFFFRAGVFFAASSLFLFFLAPRHVHTRGLHQACLSPLEESMTSRFFRTGQRDAARSLVLSSRSRAGHCRVDLRGPREFPFKETKTKESSCLLFFSPPSSAFGFIGPPEIFNAPALYRDLLVFKPLCRKTRTLMDSGIRRESP